MSVPTAVRTEPIPRRRHRASAPLAPAANPAVASLGPVTTTEPAMAQVLRTLERLARSDVTVTLLGETGVGKDVLAHAVHAASTRAKGPFVTLDCGSIPAGLVESELFGHERGAFSGAAGPRQGAVERAHGGTLFLDEIGELPLELQPTLLRVLESRRVRRVGATSERAVDIRVIAATNRELGAARQAGEFRSDLYFRLAAALVHVPPLRERLGDLPLLVGSLLASLGRRGMRVSEEAIVALAAHEWRGNVRELKNVLAYALLFVDGDELEAIHLWPSGRAGHRDPVDAIPLGGYCLARIECAAIRQTLDQTGGSQLAAAAALGIPLDLLEEKLRFYAI